MAIHILNENYKNKDGQNATAVEIANGDLRALVSAAEKYGVRGIDDMIAFAIGVLDEANGNPVAVTDKGGRFKKFIPSKAITKDANRQEEN